MATKSTEGLPRKYRFQFNGDIDSCKALESMFRDGWEFQEFLEPEGGFSLILLVKWK